MVQRLFDNLATFLTSSTTSRNTVNQHYLEYAKTEYRNDWQYAYQYMLDHEGKGPKDQGYKKFR